MKNLNKFISSFVTSGLSLFVAFVLMSGVASAEEYPSKAVTMIIPYGAGGSTDTMGRIFAKALSKELGQPVVVINRKGGGGAIGASFLKNAEPDGYTILFGGVDEIAAWAPLASEVDFTTEDFRFIGAVANYQNALVAPDSQPFKSLDEFIVFAKKNPGLAVVSQGGMSGKFISNLAKKEGLKLRMVNANSGSEAMQLLLANNAILSYSGGVHTGYSGTVNVLASLNGTRLVANPKVKTYKEYGYDLVMPSLIGLMAPVQVIDPIAKTLENALMAATKDESFVTIVEERLKSKVEPLSSKAVTSAIKEMSVSLKPIAQN